MARLHIRPWLGLAPTRNWRDDGGIERELETMPQAVGDDLDAPLVTDRRVEVHVTEAHVPCDPRAACGGASLAHCPRKPLACVSNKARS